MKKIYVSGRITGLPFEEAAAVFGNASITIEQATNNQLTAINPIDLDHSGHSKRWIDFMQVDVAALLECNGVYMCKGWGLSRGARVERIIAQELNMPIIYSNDLQSITYLHEHTKHSLIEEFDHDKMMNTIVNALVAYMSPESSRPTQLIFPANWENDVYERVSFALYKELTGTFDFVGSPTQAALDTHSDN